jgi:hypothetical protein
MMLADPAIVTRIVIVIVIVTQVCPDVLACCTRTIFLSGGAVVTWVESLVIRAQRP